jgi:hypothetical protein
MTPVMDPTTLPQQQTAVDLPTALRNVLQASTEPLTVSKIRSDLPASLRRLSLEEITDALQKQVGAGTLYQYPKYRSQQDRFWDRPMPVHIASLLRVTLEEAPLSVSELKRKLPTYAQAEAEAILIENVGNGLLHKHPKLGSRGGERFGAKPADPKDYLRPELAELFSRLSELGFSQAQMREAALELLHDEEWSMTAPVSRGDTMPGTHGSATGIQEETRPGAADAFSNQ